MRFFAVGAILGAAMLVTACGGGGGVAAIIGLDQKNSTPDEFAVVRRAALTLPPDFSLRPPDPDGAREQNLEARNDARQAVFGDDARERALAAEQQAKQSGASLSELSLLRESGALETDPNIRKMVENETASLSDVDQDLVDDLLFWRRENAPQGDILDANAETKRIQENASLGVDITTGDTPIIRRSEDDPLFNWF